MNLLERISGLAVEHLSREHVLALRSQYHALRARLHPALKLMNGTFGAEDLRRCLEQHVPDDFEILMVHSSVNHMAPMFTGTPLDLLRMLVDFCGPARTLAMPAFYFGELTAGDVVASYQRNPRFDVRRTPSQTGILSELFRRSKGVRQSLHPTHRVAALGPLAEALTVGHDRATSGCGAGTPFAFMAERRTRIIGIGKPYEVLTQVHHVEDLLGDAFPVPHVVRAVDVIVRDESGDERPYSLRVREFQRPRNMWRLEQIMAPAQLRQWTFHRVPMFSTTAGDVTDTLLAAARRGVTLYQDTRR